MAIKPEGGGGKALMARPLKKRTFFAASLSNTASKTKQNMVKKKWKKSMKIKHFTDIRHKGRVLFLPSFQLILCDPFESNGLAEKNN